MRISVTAVMAIATLLVLNLPVSAVMLTFTHAGSGSGSLSGVTFPVSDFVITTTADTANRQSYAGGSWWVLNSSASIWIAGLGNLSILTTTKEFVNISTQTVGFSQGIMGQGHDLFSGPTNAVFGTWDMLGPIGPISGTGRLLQWTYSPQLNTTGGVLLFNDGTCAATYTVTPEPATLSLLALGGLLLARRRRM